MERMWVFEPSYRLESAMRSSPEYIFHLLGMWPTQQNHRLSLFAWQRWRLGAAVWGSPALRWQHRSFRNKTTNEHKHLVILFHIFAFLLVFVGVSDYANTHATLLRLVVCGNEWRFSRFLPLACSDWFNSSLCTTSVPKCFFSFNQRSVFLLIFRLYSWF
jgi:hypothetical protein